MWGSRPKHYLHQPFFTFLQIQSNLLHSHKDNHPSWETSNKRTAPTDRSKPGGADKKQHLITGLNMQSCYRSIHTTTGNHKACQVDAYLFYMWNCRCSLSSADPSAHTAAACRSTQEFYSPASGTGDSLGLTSRAPYKHLWICTLYPPETERNCQAYMEKPWATIP